MTKPINLRQFRKRKARSEKEERAAANRLEHGTPKVLRDLEKARLDQDKARLDALKRDQAPDTPD
jgi:hypothetical protein